MSEAETTSARSPWPWIIIVSAVLWSAWGALHPFSGDTANSRMATVYALVHHGTWQIDPEGQTNPFASRTVDKVRVDGTLYSSKPPVMPLMMTGLYAVMRGLGVLDLDDEPDRVTLLKIQTLLLITLPFAVSGIAFLVTLRSFGLDDRVTSLGLLALLWGTEYAGYAGTLNNHVPATAALITALGVYRGVGAEKNVQTGILCLVAGIALGLAVTIDLPITIFAVVLAGAFIIKFPPRNVILGILGALLPIGVHCAVMVMLHGSPLPFQMNDSYYQFEESYWRDPYGIDGLNHPLGLYQFNMTIGRVGVFLMYPIVALGLIALLRQIGSREQRYWAVSILGAFGILFLYYLLTTNNYGGASFGFRWMIGIGPFFVLAVMQRLHEQKSAIGAGVVWFCIVISMLTALQCRLNVWSVNQEWPQWIFGPLA